MSPTTGRPIPFANGVLGKRYHVCAFFHSADEEYRVMLPFYLDGLQRGERCFQIVDSQLRADHVCRLTAAGIDVEAVERSGQLQVRDWHQTYLRDGRFDHGRMLAAMQQILAEGPRSGYPLTRVMGHAEWSSGDWPGVKDLLKYEARLNDIISTDTGPVICVYNLSKLAAGLVIDVMRTHPMVVIGGVLQENPFYMAPEELLREFHDRDV